MASFRVGLDAPNNIVLVMITEDDAGDFDSPRPDATSSRARSSRDFGSEWVEDMESRSATINARSALENESRNEARLLHRPHSLGVSAMPDGRSATQVRTRSITS
jgi:hypothetical protein